MRLQNIIAKIKWRLRPAYIANKFGYSLAPKGLSYFSAEDVVPKAAAANQTLCEYLESTNKGGVGKRRDMIIETLKQSGIFDNKKSIAEIGAGTGMYLEKTIELAKPETYEVFETAQGWVKYLKDTYGNGNTRLICHNADSRSLQPTADASVDVVLVHGVFVYLPLLVTMRYLEECVRITKAGGFIVFDVFSSNHFDFATVDRWLNDEFRYTFPVITCELLIEEFASARNLELVKRFETPYHGTISTYFIYKKT